MAFAALAHAEPVHICVGRWIWPGGSTPFRAGYYDISVDGAPVGRIKLGHPLTLDLPRGPHTFVRFQHTIWGPIRPLTLNIELSGETSIAANYYQATNPRIGALAGAVGGAIGGLIEESARGAPGGASHPPGEFFEEGTC